MKILVVEDEESLRLLYKDALGRHGHDVELSPDGWEGFKEGGSGIYDLVIADLNMPNWDGVTAIESMSALHPHLSFIVITGFSEAEEADRARTIPQVHSVLSKPVDLKELISLIDSIS